MPSKNKTAIVTGAAKGIGKGIAIALAKDGFNIVVADMKQDECDAAAKELKGLGVEAAGIVCDVSNAAAVAALFKQTVK